MKPRPFLRRILLVCLAIFSLWGMVAARLPEPAALGERPPTATPGPPKYPRLLKVKTVLQSRYTSCGEAVITMAYNYANPEKPIHEDDVIELATERGWFTERNWPFTSPEDMVKLASQYVETLRTGNVGSREEGLALLAEQLREGEPVIIDVLARMYDPDSPPHFILVTGISTDPRRGEAVMIHYNDPLSGREWVRRWEGNEGVWNAWQNNGDPGGLGWWMAIPPP